MAAGKHLSYTRHAEPIVNVLDVETEKVLRHLKVPHSTVTHLDHRMETLICGGKDGIMSFHDIRYGEGKSRLLAYKAPGIQSVVFY